MRGACCYCALVTPVLTVFPPLPSPCAGCGHVGLQVSATSVAGRDGSMVLVCRACGHTEFAVVPARDVALMTQMAAAMWQCQPDGQLQHGDRA